MCRWPASWMWWRGPAQAAGTQTQRTCSRWVPALVLVVLWCAAGGPVLVVQLMVLCCAAGAIAASVRMVAASVPALRACHTCQHACLPLALPPPPQIVIGRNQGATMQLNDGEISGQHAAVRWSSVDKCWKVRSEAGARRAAQGRAASSRL